MPRRAEHPRQAPALIARHRDPYERAPSPPPPERHIDATVPGELVQMDCFFIGRLSGSKGSVWQYTAIDVASRYAWAELHSSQRNPRSRHCQALLHRLAHELALAGWKLQTVTTDNGSEFVSQDFVKAAHAAGGRQRRIKAGRPTSNGCVKRVQLTILEECWRPSFARSLVPKLTALRRDLDQSASPRSGAKEKARSVDDRPATRPGFMGAAVGVCSGR